MMFGAFLLAFAQGTNAQQATPPPAATTDAPASQTPQAATPAAAPAKSEAPKQAKGKAPKPSQMDVIRLPPAPILDDKGNQMVDADGNPLFTPARVQLRDKKGRPMFDKDNQPVFPELPSTQPLMPVDNSEPAAGAPAPGAGAPTPAAGAAQTVAKPGAGSPKNAAKSGKPVKGKPVYTGPTEVIKLQPTPMLDEEGKQRLDTDGNPMFNAPLVQKRDKKGHPEFDAFNRPVFQTATDKGYDAKGKKIPVPKVKVVKTIPVVVSRGTFTVDGMIGKAELNYTISSFKYFYLYAPGVGVAVVSNAPFPGATMQKAAFNDTTLTIMLEDHKMQLASDKPLLGKTRVAPAYVALNRDFRLPSKFPVVGYGSMDGPPYQWPGSKRNGKLTGIITPPPTPKNLLPSQLLPPCAPGLMRRPAPRTLPGEEAPEQPCVPITKALQQQETENAAKTAKPAKTPDAADTAAPPPPAPAEAAPATPPPADSAVAPAATPPPATPPPSLP